MTKTMYSKVYVTVAFVAAAFLFVQVDATISVVSENTNETVALINDLPARFIPERFSFYGIQGYVVYADPPSACGKVEPPPSPSSFSPSIDHPINWILLARRSPDCHFQTKIENAQNAGYTAIIIHNVGSNGTEIMGVEDPSKIIIYATFVGEYDGEILRNYTYLNHPNEFYIRIQDDFSINSYLLPFAIVVGLCFIVMIIFMVRLLWQQVIRWIRERRRSRRRKLPASALKKIPTKKWTKGDKYETCAVCLEDFLEQDKIRVLPCDHGYHQKCIDPWLTKGRRVCPICKRKVIVADERFRDSDTDTDDETAPLLGTSAASNSQNPASGEGTFVQTLESHSQRPRGRRPFGIQPRVSADSDSSSMTSVSSQHSGSLRSFGIPISSPSHNSHEVLAEVHHSTEVLRQRIEEIEHQRQGRINDTQSLNSGRYDSRSRSDIYNSQDNAVYVPEVEFEDPNASMRSKPSIPSLSSPLEEEPLPLARTQPEVHVRNLSSTTSANSEPSSSSITTNAVV